MSTQTPDNELGTRYFGKVALAMVPGRDTDSPPATQFFFQDQIGLHIDGLKQHLRLPFTVRVFNVESGRLVAEVQSDDAVSAQPTVLPSPSRLARSRLRLACGPEAVARRRPPGATPAPLASTLSASGTRSSGTTRAAMSQDVID